MKIPAIRIEVNGELVAVAGAEDLSLLTGQVGLAADSSGKLELTNIMFHVLGLAVSGPRPRQLSWGHDIKLKLGDKVTFQVVEAEQLSTPCKVLGSPSAEELASAAAVEGNRKKGKAATPNPSFKRTTDGAA